MTAVQQIKYDECEIAFFALAVTCTLHSMRYRHCGSCPPRPVHRPYAKSAALKRRSCNPLRLAVLRRTGALTHVILNDGNRLSIDIFYFNVQIQQKR